MAPSTDQRSQNRLTAAMVALRPLLPRWMKREIDRMNAEPPSGWWACPVDGDPLLWEGGITGPEGTPYEGGTFFLELRLSEDYPCKPPRVKFLTRVYHCNVCAGGVIGEDYCDMLGPGWSPVLTIARVLSAVRDALADPCDSAPSNPEIAELYQNDRERHDRTAREWTERYAMADEPPRDRGRIGRDADGMLG